MQWRSLETWWRHSGAGLAVMVGIVALLALPAHHPYYFGDELISFASVRERGGWSGAYEVLNSYKPRLVYNALWAWIAASDMPRWVPMWIVIVSLGAAAMSCRRIAMVNLGASALAGWLVAAVVVTSRFGTVVFHDYISGTIEALSLALFFLHLSLVLDRIQRRIEPDLPRTVAMLASAMALVFVHERYAAALLPVGAALAIRGWMATPGSRRDILLGLAIAVVPAAVFVSATQIVSVMPIGTGTAGESVRPSMELVQVWWSYLANVFLGTNFGHPWLVGSIQWDDPQWRPVILVLAASLALAWSVPLLVRRLRSTGHPLVSMSFVAVALALAAVASLPGADRQEGRWMIPVLACAALLACAWARSHARIVLLCLLLACNAVYYWSGSWQAIYNVLASNTAEELADGLDSLVPGSRGLLLNVAEQDYDWPIGGNAFAGNEGTSGDVFCALNIDSDACIDPPSAVNLQNHARYDFALYFIRNEGGRKEYRILSRPQIAALLDPGGIEPGDVAMLGGGGDWTAWKWNEPPQPEAGGVVVTAGVAGTLDVPVGEISGKLLVYRARGTDPNGTVPMRLQVNWADASGVYMGASLIVVDVGSTMANYLMFVSPPEGAASGQVYATLHDGASGAVLIESIGVLER